MISETIRKVIVTFFSAGKQLGLNNPEWLQRIHHRIMLMQIPFPVRVQGLKMPYVHMKNFLSGIHEPATTLFMKKEVKEGWKVVDLGAQHGYYTLLLASLVGRTGRVFSFEPHPESFKHLTMGIRANSFQNVLLIHKAVSSTLGTAPFYVSSISRGRNTLASTIENTGSIPVEVTTLDDTFPNETDIRLVKMDIEGLELEAMKGARGFIERNRDVTFLIELSPRTLIKNGIDPQRFLDEVRSYGLEIRYVTDQGVVEKRDDRDLIAIAMVGGHINIHCSHK